MRGSCIAFVALALLASVAAAQEPDVPYSAADLAPSRSDVPAGWQTSDAFPSVGPTAKRLVAMAEAVGVSGSGLSATSRAFRGPAGAAVVSLVDVPANADASTFRAALAWQTKALGWEVAELGSSAVLVVVSAPQEAASALVAWQRELAVYKLADLAWERMRSATNREEFQAAQACLSHAARIEPNAGVLKATAGRVFWASRNRAAAAQAFRESLAEDVPLPPRGALAAEAAGLLGLALLLEEKDELLAEALNALTKAVAWEEHVAEVGQRFNNRYNLACAYARLDRKDEAFAELEKSLALGKEAFEAGRYAEAYEHAREKDPDMQNLRSDERFRVLFDKYAPPAAAEAPKDG